MKSVAWWYLLLSVILWISRTIGAVLSHRKRELTMHDAPCYICAAEWKLQNNNRRVIIEYNEQAKLAEDEDKCEATIVREVMDTLKMMQPESWQNTAIDGSVLKRDTEELLNENQNPLSVEQFRKKLAFLSSRWEKYRMQQDFNKWTALRHWLRLPTLRHRLQVNDRNTSGAFKVLEKDLKSEKQSRRLRRLLQRVQEVQNMLQIVGKNCEMFMPFSIVKANFHILKRFYGSALL
ncbi:3 (2)-bisphosphate nucleotidase 1 [Dirofilaria immitis]|nr:3 (2)-bisphosphate nucleotidase 1 [Dirofilaria immitis]